MTYEALVVLLRKRPDLKAVVECVNEDGSYWKEVVECILAKGVAKTIRATEFRIRQLAKYGVLLEYRVKKYTILVPGKEFLKVWRKIASQEPREKKP